MGLFIFIYAKLITISCVAQGVLRNGVEVAVKMLSAESKQGTREFLTEIDTISNVKHPNLVELLGCCVHEPHKILVYEYIENSSLDRALLGIMNTQRNHYQLFISKFKNSSNTLTQIYVYSQVQTRP